MKESTPTASMNSKDTFDLHEKADLSPMEGSAFKKRKVHTPTSFGDLKSPSSTADNTPTGFEYRAKFIATPSKLIPKRMVSDSNMSFTGYSDAQTRESEDDRDSLLNGEEKAITN
mmetsp:Transcript_10175/g.8721  ORF Transcript_10175/g.8721 Transcript_10175/m.8721 type:complete len:115 (-) Transcript_10175:540-884(-)|eukprot:CAMPEP_0114588452 /NCGR_PEP_ID=MMETSP0125-20121206/11151_1 /TAXON_ID=485358 ORGANISM="Aristerostoma sp., Strain ATCC 50986" /NCGR_SAMPLE_ID=MMETSP0125 /ASSEMBLY_ACC=CAM_ASM_000245 /LENGTH=114 /DNA_ID=CAMNT_0001784855 /DNA_START=302 /DNA_END=646 /DNA_ORIENTATION=-